MKGVRARLEDVGIKDSKVSVCNVGVDDCMSELKKVCRC